MTTETKHQGHTPGPCPRNLTEAMDSLKNDTDGIEALLARVAELDGLLLRAVEELGFIDGQRLTARNLSPFVAEIRAALAGKKG